MPRVAGCTQGHVGRAAAPHSGSGSALHSPSHTSAPRAASDETFHAKHGSVASAEPRVLKSCGRRSASRLAPGRHGWRRGPAEMARIASSALRRAVEEAVVEALAGTGRCARSAATALRMATVVAAVAAKARGAIHSPCEA